MALWHVKPSVMNLVQNIHLITSISPTHFIKANVFMRWKGVPWRRRCSLTAWSAPQTRAREDSALLCDTSYTVKILCEYHCSGCQGKQFNNVHVSHRHGPGSIKSPAGSNWWHFWREHNGTKTTPSKIMPVVFHSKHSVETLTQCILLWVKRPINVTDSFLQMKLVHQIVLMVSR